MGSNGLSPHHFFLFMQPKKTKNISRDVFGTKHGKIHMQKQDLGNLQIRKMKALKRKSGDATGDVETDQLTEKKARDSS